MLDQMFRYVVRAAVVLISVMALQVGSVTIASALSPDDPSSASLVVNGFTVDGPILAKYQALGGSAVTGAPTSDSFQTAPRTGLNGSWQEFQNGVIFYSEDTGARWVVNGVFRNAYFEGCGFFCYGMPVSDVLSGARNSKILQTQFGGNLYWSAATGLHQVWSGALLNKYISLGGTTSWIGLPIADSSLTPDGAGEFVRFQNGVLYWSSTTGAHGVHGAILAKWNTLGAASGSLGFPTSEEFSVAGGRRSNFENGYIFWSSTTRQATAVLS